MGLFRYVSESGDRVIDRHYADGKAPSKLMIDGRVCWRKLPIPEPPGDLHGGGMAMKNYRDLVKEFDAMKYIKKPILPNERRAILESQFVQKG